MREKGLKFITQDLLIMGLRMKMMLVRLVRKRIIHRMHCILRKIPNVSKVTPC